MKDLKALFNKNVGILCVLVALSAIIPVALIDWVEHRSSDKEDVVMICKFSGGLLGMECHPTDRRIFIEE